MIDFQPPLSALLIAATVAGMVAACALLRYVLGPPRSAGRAGWLLGLRVLTLMGLLTLLLGPVYVSESPGPSTQPELFLLVDGSQSMAIGTEATRWDEAWNLLAQADASLTEEHRTGLPVFWFGHRLHPAGTLHDLPGASTAAAENVSDQLAAETRPLAPPDSDTRLADALKQLTSRFGRRQPDGVVVLSDGRARDSVAVEEACARFASRGIPLHVVPLGDTNRGGDVAIVSVVAPARVRKYADVEVQVFFRSFGYTGTRTLVELVSHETVGGVDAEEVLASVPVTLRGGAQSATLLFRSDTRPTQIEIRIPPQPDEISNQNNIVTTDIGIDRTKIRVLYLEGADRPVRTIQTGENVRYEGAHSPLQDALTQDDDIACIALVASPDWAGFRRLQNGSVGAVSSGFPATMAELSAYDCVVLSSVAAGNLTKPQIEWLVRWVENRGGGLWMAGGPDSFRGGRWEETALVDVLPVTFDNARWQMSQPVTFDPQRVDAHHPLFKIVSDPEQNAAALRAMPPVSSGYTGLVPKPAADVLAYGISNDEQGRAESVIVSGRHGRGRTLAMAFPITEPAADDWLHNWQPGGNRYSAKFCRNAIYWLTEGSQIGRRRLVARVDKRFYRPGETVALQSAAYDETASRTTGYRVWGMIEPRTLDFDNELLYAPVQWPSGVLRESGESGPLMVWGEEFELPKDPESGEYVLPLELAKRLSGQLSGQGLRIELTAYEETSGAFAFGRGTQVDSTSLELQILDDPFEQQNPFPNHDLLVQAAKITGGTVLRTPEELRDLIEARPVDKGPTRVSVSPAWSSWWVWAIICGLLSIEWIARRRIGMA